MQTPAPNTSDSEDVVTALETAQIFAAKGDDMEAVRWLRRAADCASQKGDASRALSLTHSADALLAEPVDAVTEDDFVPISASDRRLPTPPAARTSAPPPPPSARGTRDDSQPMLLVRTATPAPGSVKAVTASPSVKATPAPASVRPAKPSVAPSKPSVAPVKPSTPPPSLTPRPATASASATPVARATSARPLATALASRPSATLASREQEESAVRESSPVAAKPVTNERPNSRPLRAAEMHHPFSLHGSRASITPSEGSTRFYVLQLLDDREPVPADGHEAFVVLVDPRSKLSH